MNNLRVEDICSVLRLLGSQFDCHDMEASGTLQL